MVSLDVFCFFCDSRWFVLRYMLRRLISLTNGFRFGYVLGMALEALR